VLLNKEAVTTLAVTSWNVCIRERWKGKSSKCCWI